VLNDFIISTKMHKKCSKGKGNTTKVLPSTAGPRDNTTQLTNKTKGKLAAKAKQQRKAKPPAAEP
jgi:hypothetical protein